MSFSPMAPFEQDFFGTDWTDELASGETISSAEVVVEAKRGSARVSSPAAILSGTATISGAIVSQKLVNPVPGVAYETYWRITTSLPRVLEERVTLIVR